MLIKPRPYVKLGAGSLNSLVVGASLPVSSTWGLALGSQTSQRVFPNTVLGACTSHTAMKAPEAKQSLESRIPQCGLGLLFSQALLFLRCDMLYGAQALLWR